MRDPPGDIPTARLFRLLLATPRATWPILHRIRGAEDIPLSVRALVPIEEAECYSASDGAETDHLGRSRVVVALIAASLLAPRGRAFASAAEVGRLSEREVNVLGVQVVKALDVISPSYTTTNSDLWHAKLKLGAKDPRNSSIVLAMNMCVDVSHGYGVTTKISRPDRYFGLPTSMLTDGQRMVYAAARSVYEERAKSRA